MRRTLLHTATLAAIIASAISASVDAAVDPKAAAIADQVLAELGGQKAWDGTRYLHFGFGGRRLHWWDKWDGRYRLEGKTKEGQGYVVLMNVNTKAGAAWLDGQPLQGEALAKQLENAYGTWINDTYWLLMPYKLRDPGVNLAYDGEEKIGDATYDKLALSFERVGLTPGDRYWAFINRATHRMDRWAYVLEDDPAGKGPTAWLWQDWQRYGNILLSSLRQQVSGERSIALAPIEAPATLPDAVFTDPKPLG